jgi:hypothetical protein
VAFPFRRMAESWLDHFPMLWGRPFTKRPVQPHVVRAGKIPNTLPVVFERPGKCRIVAPPKNDARAILPQ